MENNNKSKSLLGWERKDEIIFYSILIIIAILAIGIILLKYFDYQSYIYTAYIKLPNNEICMKEYKHYDITGSMVTLMFADGTKITTSTKNVTLIKTKKGINNGDEYILK